MKKYKEQMTAEVFKKAVKLKQEDWPNEFDKSI
jgi:hypothetical protein